MEKGNLFVVIMYIYLVSAHICMLYFWYLWSQSHEFLSTLIIGPFVAEIKGLLFPFFI
jgi:hypothetical protein